MEADKRGSFSIGAIKGRIREKILVARIPEYDTGGWDYMGPNHTVHGKILQERQGGRDVPIFKINFTPLLFDVFPRFQRIKSPKRRKQALQNGIEDFVDFLTVLRDDERFKDVETIIGATNYDMAKIAERSLGFQVVGKKLEDIDPEDRKEPWIRIQISKAGLLDQQDRLSKILTRLKGQ